MKIVFMGTPDFAAHILHKLIDEKHEVVLVVSQPDRPVGRKKERFATPVKKVAMDAYIPVFQPEKIKEDQQAILDVNPDIIITAAYGQMIPKTLLDIPRLGCVNVHASLLPQYRGGAPIHRAIIDGNSVTGVTLMYMDEKMDTGDMIAQASTPIEAIDDVASLFKRLSHIGAKLLVDTLPAIESGTNARIEQNHDEATYAYNIKREDELIDWSKDAAGIYNQIRGLNPWPTAYTTINGINVKIFKSEMLSSDTSERIGGEVVNISTDGIDVVCGSGGVLRLVDLQLAGKKRIAMKDLLNGSHPFEVGQRFGSIF